MKSLKELEQRKHELENLKTSLHIKQLSLKILMNSLYGAMGNVWFRGFDIRLAQTITVTGRRCIKCIGQYVNDYFAKRGFKDILIYQDTDSVYFQLDSIVKAYYKKKGIPIPDDYTVTKFLDRYYEKKIAPVIKEAIELLAKEFNAVDIHEEHNYFQINREVIGNVGFWEAKKRYCISIIDNEGIIHDPPKKKIMGMDCIKRIIPPKIREIIKTEVLDLILNEDEDGLREFNHKFRAKFYKMELKDIAEIKPINNFEKYMNVIREPMIRQKAIDNGFKDWNSIALDMDYEPSDPKYEKYLEKLRILNTVDIPLKHPLPGVIPGSVRGAIQYNALIREMKLHDKYPFIEANDKVCQLQALLPNKTGLKYIVFPHGGELPIEFNMHSRIDKVSQFDKVYRNVVENMMYISGWDYIKKISLF